MVSKPLPECWLGIEFFANAKRLLYDFTLFSTDEGSLKLCGYIKLSLVSSLKLSPPLTRLHNIGSLCSSLSGCCNDARLVVFAYIGMQKEKTLPQSGPSESAYIVPPLLSTIVFAISRPRHLSFFKIKLLSSKRLCSWSNEIPSPVSQTWTSRLYLATLYSTLIIMLPYFVKLIAFFIRFIMTYIKRRSSPISHGRARKCD